MRRSKLLKKVVKKESTERKQYRQYLKRFYKSKKIVESRKYSPSDQRPANSPVTIIIQDGVNISGFNDAALESLDRR